MVVEILLDKQEHLPLGIPIGKELKELQNNELSTRWVLPHGL